mgnify:CR=1 FL=1
MLKFVDAEAQNNLNWFHERLREAMHSYPILGFNLTTHIGVTLDSPGYQITGVEPLTSITSTLHPQWRLPYTVVDVGANVGAFTWMASGFALDVRAYEPSKQTFERLSSNVQKHCLHPEEIQLHNLAVGPTSGETVYLTSHGSNLSGDASTQQEKPEDSPAEAVQTICLEDILASTSLGRIDYLKVDCEGAEYDFLLDKDLSQVGFLIIELHGDDEEAKKSLREWISQTHSVHALAEDSQDPGTDPTHFRCLNYALTASFHTISTVGIINKAYDHLPEPIMPSASFDLTRSHNDQDLFDVLFTKTPTTNTDEPTTESGESE